MKNSVILNVLILVLVALTSSCSTDKGIDENSQGEVNFSFSYGTDLKSTSTNEVDKEAHAIYITVKDSDDEYILNLEKLPLIKIGDSYITEHIQLNHGDYTIEDFIVVDSNDSSLYLTPKANSKFESYVSNPLPLSFEISDNLTNSLVLEVIPANLGEAVDFGYATFSFTIIDMLDRGLVAYYPFTGDASDASGNEYHGTVNGATFRGDSTSEASSYYFDGVKDFITTGNILNNVTAGDSMQFSFSFWMRPQGLGGKDMMIINKNADSNCNEDQRQFSVQKSKENKICFVWHSSLDFTSYRKIISTTALSDTTKWYHVAINYDGSNYESYGFDRVEIYIDGKIEKQTLEFKNTSFGNIQEGTAHFAFGSQVSSNGVSSGVNSFNGFLDEIRIYNRLLESVEIEKLSTEN